MSKKVIMQIAKEEKSKQDFNAFIDETFLRGCEHPNISKKEKKYLLKKKKKKGFFPDKAILILSRAFGVHQVSGLIIGQTGCGKTSLISSLFRKPIKKLARGIDFRSRDINDYTFQLKKKKNKKKKIDGIFNKPSFEFPKLVITDVPGQNDQRGFAMDIMNWMKIIEVSKDRDYDFVFVCLEIGCSNTIARFIFREMKLFLGKSMNFENCILVLTKVDRFDCPTYLSVFKKQKENFRALWKEVFGTDEICVVCSINVAKETTKKIKKDKFGWIVLPDKTNWVHTLFNMVDTTLDKKNKFYVGSMLRIVMKKWKKKNIELLSKTYPIPTSVEVFLNKADWEQKGLYTELQGQLTFQRTMNPDYNEFYSTDSQIERLKEYISAVITRDKDQMKKTLDLLEKIGVSSTDDFKDIVFEDIRENENLYREIKPLVRRKLMKVLNLEEGKLEGPPVPGLSWVGRGYSVLSGEKKDDIFIQEDEAKKISGGKKLQVILGQNFLVPVHIDIDTKNCRVEHSTYHSCDIGKGVKKMSMSAEAETKGLLSLLVKTKAKLPIHATWTNLRTKSYYAVVIKNRVMSVSLKKTHQKFLTEEFKERVEELPLECESEEDMEMYISFFQNYGTHFIKKISLGGYCMVQGEGEKVSKDTEYDIAAEAMVNIFKIIKGEIGAEGVVSSQKTNTRFQYKFTYAGGDKEKFPLDSFQNSGKNTPNSPKRIRTPKKVFNNNNKKNLVPSHPLPPLPSQKKGKDGKNNQKKIEEDDEDEESCEEEEMEEEDEDYYDERGKNYEEWKKSCSNPLLADIMPDEIGIGGIFEIVDGKKRIPMREATRKYILMQKQNSSPKAQKKRNKAKKKKRKKKKRRRKRVVEEEEESEGEDYDDTDTDTDSTEEKQKVNEGYKDSEESEGESDSESDDDDEHIKKEKKSKVDQLDLEVEKILNLDKTGISVPGSKPSPGKFKEKLDGKFKGITAGQFIRMKDINEDNEDDDDGLMTPTLLTPMGGDGESEEFIKEPDSPGRGSYVFSENVNGEGAGGSSIQEEKKKSFWSKFNILSPLSAAAVLTGEDTDFSQDSSNISKNLVNLPNFGRAYQLSVAPEEIERNRNRAASEKDGKQMKPANNCAVM